MNTVLFIHVTWYCVPFLLNCGFFCLQHWGLYLRKQYVSGAPKQNIEVILEIWGDESVSDFISKTDSLGLEPGFAAEDCSEQ